MFLLVYDVRYLESSPAAETGLALNAAMSIRFVSFFGKVWLGSKVIDFAVTTEA